MYSVGEFVLLSGKGAVFHVALFGALAAVPAAAQTPATSKREVPPSPTAEVGTALWRGRVVHYVMRNGLPIYQGDIILDHLVPGPDPGRVPRPDLGSAAGPDTVSRPQTLGNLYPSTLWPSVGGIHQIPYIVTNGTANLNNAIAAYNKTFSGVIQWVARTTETDYVNFYLDPNQTTGGGESAIGRTGGEQTIYCPITCNVGTFSHEMGHATGLWHEQSRPDRDNYITVDYSHFQAGPVGNDAPATNNAWIYAPFDYASIMQYSAFSLTADGFPTAQSIPAGIRLGFPNLETSSQPNGAFYTTTDIDTIRRLYNAAPTSVTVDTNPTGLQVIVDGSTITTPQTYNWALYSTHTLDIPAGVSNSGLQAQADIVYPQTPGEFYYQFARWNDGGAASHTISITPGNSQPGSPPSSPAQTVYTANFIQWTPFLPDPNGSYPAGAGTLTTTPSPTTFTGVGPMFMAEQSVNFNANANSGYNFVQWFLYYICDMICPPSLYANPMNMNIYTARNVAPDFTTSHSIGLRPGDKYVQELRRISDS